MASFAREQKLESRRRRLQKHGKNTGQIYKNTVLKRKPKSRDSIGLR